MLDSYINLKYLSRDRGKQYQALSKKYEHIADRFHLIKNLSDLISNEVKKVFPPRMKIVTESDSFLINKPESNTSISTISISKIKLIKEVKLLYKQGNTISHIARILKIDRRTVKKYAEENMDNLLNNKRRKHSKLDKYKKQIKEIYTEGMKITKLHKELEIRKIYMKYSTLKSYITKIKSLGELNTSKYRNSYFKRNDIINYILNWKYDKSITNYFKTLGDKLSLIENMRVFYNSFRKILVDLDRDKLVKLIEEEQKCEIAKQFIKNIKTDYKAVINSATYKINNGIVEGNVNKLKVIKRDMYGRASIELLRVKSIYQSHFL